VAILIQKQNYAFSNYAVGVFQTSKMMVGRVFLLIMGVWSLYSVEKHVICKTVI
jgi:hypothetical protein